MRILLFICVCLLVSCLLMVETACSHANEKPPVHSWASFILEKTAVQPGAEANVGIQFVTEKGWHIYWRNPGDSGEPPRIQWRLPAGVTAGALEWPAPKRLNTAAGTDYGYEGTTVLLSKVQFPTTAQPGATLELDGELRWLVCHDVCVPQRAQIKTPVRIASAASVDSAAQRILRASAQQIPKPLPAGFHPSVTSSPESFRLALVASEPIDQAEFFPVQAEQIDNEAAQEFATHAGATQLTLKKSDHLQQDPQRLAGVVVLNGRDAYQIDVPVQPAIAQQSRRR